ncbi:flagellar basal-body rod protein FlgG [Butyrivibrio sp. INlla18]|uniref:flagellar hook-basal body protein n=1 Tax=Butyrivibrio sp. INlla18 TaxID=1520806 RepID=UPI00088CC6A8|nr:flagellar hook-basal body protein [Butyrivibrio sp. INlla18]MCR4758030.1 flagellar hook-basal body protein [Butyrivibrio sp.]SDA43496.1 flagellar basal-body rod protein FlgG [Butyrivibrio sp. INlla18]
MVRSLWSAATGMNAQQTNVDTISNNLANVNTVGYKAQGAQFKSLLYQELQTVTTTANGTPKPTNSQVGLGVRTSTINQFFSQGSFQNSDNPAALAISGDGFFSYMDADGETQLYTRNGNFTWALTETGGTTVELTTAEGNPVLDINGNAITIDNAIASRITIGGDGKIYYPNEEGVPEPVNDLQIGIWQFRNREGLERVGSAAWKETAASGEPVLEAEADDIKVSEIVQGYLEGSNVNVATEMVNLIVAQRAYEMNSTAIQTTDEMMQTANGLKR